ncbi:MAG: hypothetical protein IJC84_06650 [Clostridia bacterium]|nr:hypothetical protein [Clostridia bacterium]
MKATKQEISRIDRLYGERQPFFGELHDHSVIGDGKCTLAQWRQGMEEKGIDFATIVDHRIVEHMYHHDFIDGLFLGGTEPATRILDMPGEIAFDGKMHYNMIHHDPEAIRTIYKEFEEYKYAGGIKDKACYPYPRFTRERFKMIVDRLYELGGFLVHPHPSSKMKSDDPTDYWFIDGMGIEIRNTYQHDRFEWQRQKDYEVWTNLLKAGKRVFATFGCDEHDVPSDRNLNTLYATRRSSKCYLDVLKSGDFNTGAVGIQMCVGETTMGGKTSFEGQRLIVRVGDFHRSVLKQAPTLRLELYAGEKRIYKAPVPLGETKYFAFDLKADAPYVRVELRDSANGGYLIAAGNPIWNEL